MIIIGRKIHLSFSKNARQASFWNRLVNKKKVNINVNIKETIYQYELFSRKLAKGYGIKVRADLFHEKKSETEPSIDGKSNWPMFSYVKWLKSDSKTDAIVDSCGYPEENISILNNGNNLLDHNLLDLYIKKNGDLLEPSDVIAKLVESGILDKEPTLLSMFGSGVGCLGLGLAIASVGVLGIACLSLIYPNKTPSFDKTINLI